VQDADVISDESLNDIKLIKINALSLNVTLQRLWSIGGTLRALKTHG